MGCDNANPLKCANCYRGSSDARVSAWVDKGRATGYKEGTKRQKAVRNAKAHKTYHTKRMILDGKDPVLVRHDNQRVYRS